MGAAGGGPHEDLRGGFVHVVAPGVAECAICGGATRAADEWAKELVHQPWCRDMAEIVLRLRAVGRPASAYEFADRLPPPASLPDQPAAPLDRRLLLALGIAESVLDMDNAAGHIVGAAQMIRARAHTLGFVIEDWSMERHFRDELLAGMREVADLLPKQFTDVGVDAAVVDRLNDVVSGCIAVVDEFPGV